MLLKPYNHKSKHLHFVLGCANIPAGPYIYREDCFKIRRGTGYYINTANRIYLIERPQPQLFCNNKRGVLSRLDTCIFCEKYIRRLGVPFYLKKIDFSTICIVG